MSVEVVREQVLPNPPIQIAEVPEWKSRHGLTAGITVRGGEHHDFGLATAAPAANTIAGWIALPKCVGGVFRKTCTGRQAHGTAILRHRATDPPGAWVVYDKLDGHITGDSGVLLTVTIADCVPVFLYSSDTGDVGLFHAGWRGVVGGILQVGIDALRAAGANPKNMVMHLGPSVCGSCYEVGSDVADQLGEPGIGARCVDLRGILVENAIKNEIMDVSVSELCTKHDEFCHSFRRDGPRSGRMVAYLGRAEEESTLGLKD